MASQEISFDLDHYFEYFNRAKYLNEIFHLENSVRNEYEEYRLVKLAEICDGLKELKEDTTMIKTEDNNTE